MRTRKLKKLANDKARLINLAILARFFIYDLNEESLHFTLYYVKLSETKVHNMNGASIIMHAIVTVIGQDRVGIIAGICVALAGINVNVLDISQTILGGMFTMVMLVDIKEASVPFGEISKVLDAEGERLGMTIRIQREDIFNAMHRI